MFLVDTNILSEQTRLAPNRSVVEWLESNEPLVRISVVSIGEIHYGIELLPDGRKRNELRKWLRDVRNTYADSILPVDDPVALRWGILKAYLDQRGRKMPMIDSLLAAAALEHNLTLVTANTKDFVFSGVKLLNPA